MKNVLSLFNGMGCIWIALDRTGIQVNKRYSSEVEKYPNKANDLLYPDTIQLGDVRNVDVSKLEPIYLLAGGSPCQSFSFAGKRKGMATKCEIEILSLEYYLELKEQNFEFEGQSYLFWEYIRILTDIRKYNPDVKFLLENVIMGSKWQKVITRAIGINPININSSLVSAQNRNRLYWTNIYTEQDGLFGDLKCMIPQPKDKGILLKDILESDVLDKYFLSEKALKFVISEERLKKKYTQNANENEKSLPHLARNKTNWCGDFVVHNTMPRSSKTGKVETGPLSRNDGKTYCLDTGNTNAIEIQCVAMRGRNPDNPKSRIAGLPTEQQLEPRKDGKTNCLTSVQKDNLVQINENKDCSLLQDLGVNHIFAYILNNLNYETEERNAYKALSMLFYKIGEKINEQQKMGIVISFSEKKVLRSIMYVKGIQENKKRESKLFRITPKKQTDNRRFKFDEKMRIVWFRTEFGCSPQGRKLEQQYFKQLANFVQVLSHERTSSKKTMYNLWETKQGIWLLRETLPTIQKIWKPICVQRESVYGSDIPKRLVRRLTPKETGRLQTVPEEKLEILINSEISDTQLYKMFGNGWTIDVIAYILSFINK